jgi:two-component system, sensor histidine kinase and response regulator
MMAGNMWVESEPGAGTKFHFTLPLIPAGEPLAVKPAGSPEAGHGMKVLVVDDNRANRKILEVMLKRRGLVPTSVESGDQAIAELLAASAAGEQYALIVCDLLMPNMDGFGFVERVREKPELSTAKIILLTSAEQRGDATRSAELGISAYLTKPVRRSELLEVISRLLDKPESTPAQTLLTRQSIADSGKPAASLRILVAEDNAVNQMLVTRLLQKRGHSVMVVGNGRDALGALVQGTYDLILMDMQMPEMDGFEATSELRRREKQTGRHLPVIALTAHAMKGDRERCLDAGMDGYLAKPIRAQALYELLENYITLRVASLQALEQEEQSK